MCMRCLTCILVMSTIPHSQEDEGLSEEERRRMSIEEVRVASLIGDIPAVAEWRGHPLPPHTDTQESPHLPLQRGPAGGHHRTPGRQLH